MTQPIHIEHDHPFDPRYGYDLEQLLRVPAPDAPADFADFWRQTYAAVRQIPLRLERREIASPDPRFKLFEVEYDSLDGVRIGGWITEPVDGRFERGVVVGHGYGGRDQAAFDLPPPTAVAIFPCARGFNRSAQPGIPGHAVRHVLHGIAQRETYSHRGSVADYWCAVSALLELYPATAKRLHYHGSSFGGGIGALLLPWDNRFHRAFLDVPSFGPHPLRLTLESVGSGEAVRRYHRRHPEVLTVLRYFDAVTAAQHITIPVLVSSALFDPAVPPPGQFAIYNALRGPKELFIRQAAHFSWPGEAAELAALSTRVAKWFSAA